MKIYLERENRLKPTQFGYFRTESSIINLPIKPLSIF